MPFCKFKYIQIKSHYFKTLLTQTWPGKLQSFFRHSVLSNVRYTCKNDGKCSVTLCHENDCASCRYDKCIDVGMMRSLVDNWGYATWKRGSNVLCVRDIRVIFSMPSTSTGFSSMRFVWIRFARNLEAHFGKPTVFSHVVVAARFDVVAISFYVPWNHFRKTFDSSPIFFSS